MIEELFYYAGSALGLAFLAFCVIWWRQKAHLPSSLGVVRLAGLFVLVWVACFVSFAFLMVGTTLSGFSNLASFQQPYIILSGIAGYLVGNNLINRMLRTKGQPVV